MRSHIWDHTVVLYHPKKIYFNSAQSVHPLSLSLFLQYRVLLSLAPSSFSLSLAFLSDHQATISPSLAFLSDHQALLFSPINKPLSESPSLCLYRFTLTHLQIHFTITKPSFSLWSLSRCHQASLFSPINKPLFESPSLYLCRFTLTHLQIRFTVTRLRFSLRSPSCCPNHQASASASADSLKLRRSLK